MPRFSENVNHYPLHLYYLRDQKINDPEYSANDIVSADTILGFSDFNFQPWNYSVDFDKAPAGKYLVNTDFTDSNNMITIPSPIPTVCADTNCDYCNANECFRCKATYYLDPTAGTCSLPIQSYWLLSPAYVKDSITTTDITFNTVSGATNNIYTVSFFVKVLGWNVASNATTYDLFRYSAKLALRYDFVNDKIELYNTTGNVIATYNSFKTLMNTWINISMSYYYDNSNNAYFPAMINFQVNFTPVTVSLGTNIENLGVDVLVIPKESIAIYAKVWVWDKYFTGAWGIMYKDASSPYTTIKKYIDATIPNTITDCLDSANDLTITNIDYVCVLEYVNVLDSQYLCSTATAAMENNSGTCLAQNTQCSHGFYSLSTTDYCSCIMNVSDMFVNKHDNKNYCQKLDYADFARFSSPISLTGISSSTGSTGYTMDLWIYINPYVANQFVDFNIKWNKQLWIKIDYNSGIQTTCYPVYENGVTPNNSYTFSINPTQWTYLRCSVDTTNNKFYHINENMAISLNNLTDTPATLSATDALELSHNSLNRAVIFIRQLRLWKCYDCQLGDLHSLYLDSTSAAQHTDLLHIWDPIYNSGTAVNDLKTSANPLSFTQDNNWIGYNILDLNKYYNVITPTYTDFTLYPENNTVAPSGATADVPTDYIYKTNEIFYGAWYFADNSLVPTPANLEDKRNGILIKPYSVRFLY